MSNTALKYFEFSFTLSRSYLFTLGNLCFLILTWLKLSAKKYSSFSMLFCLAHKNSLIFHFFFFSAHPHSGSLPHVLVLHFSRSPVPASSTPASRMSSLTASTYLFGLPRSPPAPPTQAPFSHVVFLFSLQVSKPSQFPTPQLVPVLHNLRCPSNLSYFPFL